MAGAEGIEPSSKVLETSVLPLNHAPSGDNYTLRNCLLTRRNNHSFFMKASFSLLGISNERLSSSRISTSGYFEHIS